MSDYLLGDVLDDLARGLNPKPEGEVIEGD